MEILYNLQQEINRLFIAGSKFAKNDPRLQKHIPVLNKLGEKAPVFAKLSKDLEDLLNADSQSSAEKLTAISTLLYSVLYTQGAPIEANALRSEQVPDMALEEVNTEFSYLQLKPVIQALTVSNSGRLEILVDAFERNIFKDSRTYPYLNMALGDKYAELCDYVEKTIIPSIGKPMLPFLLQGFQWEDKTENVRRFRLLQQLGYEEISKMIDQTFAESLPNLQAEAIVALSKDATNEEFIKNMTSDKNKIVRGAAYRALAHLGTPTSVDALYHLYQTHSGKNKTNAELIAEALSCVSLPKDYKKFFEKVKECFENLLATDKSDEKSLQSVAERFVIDLDMLANKDYDEVYDFFGRIFSDTSSQNLLKAKSMVAYKDLIYEKIGKALHTFDNKKVIAFYEKHHKSLPTGNYYYTPWYDYFDKAANVYPKEKIFEVFSPQFENALPMSYIYGVFTNNRNFYYHTEHKLEVYTEKIDPRWAKIFESYLKNIKKWDYSHLQALWIVNKIEADRKKVHAFIENMLPKAPHDARIPLYELIMDNDFSDKFEMIYGSIEKVPKHSYSYVYNRLKNIGFWTKFPKQYAQKFRDLSEKTKLEVYEEIAQEIENQ